MTIYTPTATKRVTQPVDRQIEWGNGGRADRHTLNMVARSVAKVGNVKPDAKPTSSVRCSITGDWQMDNKSMSSHPIHNSTGKGNLKL